MDYTEELNKFISKSQHGLIRVPIRRTLWSGMDNKNSFEKNLKKYPVLLKCYEERPIVYQLNNYKYRSEFDFRVNKNLKVDIYLGCSHTKGIGHYWENTWPYHVSKHTGNKIVNLGVGGSGMELAFTNFLKFINFFDIQNVFHFQPVYARHLIVFKDVFQKSDLKTVEDYKYLPWKKEYILDVMINDDFIVYNHFKHSIAIEGICRKKGINYFHLTDVKVPSELGWNVKSENKPITRDSEGMPVEEEWVKVLPKGDTIARDVLHMTAFQLKAIADQFINTAKHYPNGYSQISNSIDKISVLKNNEPLI